MRIATQASIKVLRQLTCVITHFNIQQKKKKIFTITTPAYLWITVSHTGQIQKTGSFKSALWWPHIWTNDSFPAQSDNKRDILKIWTALQQFTLTELIKFYLKWFYNDGNLKPLRRNELVYKFYEAVMQEKYLNVGRVSFLRCLCKLLMT